MIKLKALLQENISTSLLNTIKKDPSLKKLGMVNVTAGTEIAYGSTKAPLTIFIDPSKTKIDDVYFLIIFVYVKHNRT